MEQQTMEWMVDFGNDQHQGARAQQQDYFALTDPNDAKTKGFLAVVADGMGGHAGGGNASVIAITRFIEEWKKPAAPSESIPEALRRALEKANEAVFQANERLGEESDMGTTLVACVLQAQKLYWVSVGDSSLFLWRNGKLRQLNHEHSYGAELDRKLAAGEITPDEASAETKKRNMLTSYLGLETIPQIDLSIAPEQVASGDKILLCTDGLVNAMNHADLEFALREEGKSAQAKCEFLTQQALKKQLPKQDNLTTILVEIQPKPVEPIAEQPQSENPIVKIALIAMVIVALIIVTTVILNRKWLREQLRIFPQPTVTAVSAETPVPTNTPHESRRATATPVPPTESPIDDPTPTPSQESGNHDQPSSAPLPIEVWVQRDPDIVLKMQVVLSNLLDRNRQRLYKGRIDRDFGERTQKALQAFQETFREAKNLNPTGKLDEATYEALQPYFKQFEFEIEQARKAPMTPIQIPISQKTRPTATPIEPTPTPGQSRRFYPWGQYWQ